MKIGYTDIVGDLFHYGHIMFLENVKKYCDYLIVGITGDEYCKNYKRIPIMTQYERGETVKYCKFVDKIIIDCPTPITLDFINKYNINIVFHAHKEEESNIYDYYYKVALEKGIFKRLDYNNKISTSNLINRIKNRNDL